MGKAGYTGNQPDRTLSARSYPGAWNVDEQFIERKNGDWPEYPAPISRSLRFNSSDSAYLSRTPASAGNRKTWTWAGWVKRSALAATQGRLFGGGITSTNYFELYFPSSDQLRVIWYEAGQTFTTTTAVFRDPSAWYHIILAVDTTQATAANRIKLYVNGIEQTRDATNPTQNFDTSVNSTVEHDIGRYLTGSGSDYFNGYLADIHFIDGQALDPTSFGEFDDNGIWQPIKYRGVYGNNGFHIPFSDNSTAAALGTDTSGNGNTWTVNNLSVTAGAGNDSLVDVPTNGAQTDTGVGGEVRGNYCTLNPLNTHTSITLSNGNLDYSHGSSGGITVGTIGVSTGKWYWEHVASTSYTLIGLYQSGSLSMEFVGTSGVSLGLTSGGFVATSGGPTYVNSVSYGTSDVIGFALDMDAGTLTIYKNGSATSLVFSGLTGTWFPAEGANSTSSGVFNFGARSFAYTAPSGFKALCTANLPAPVVTKPSDVFDILLWTGDGTSRTISGLNLSSQADLVWIKCRGAAPNHVLQDSVRGFGNAKNLTSNSTGSEGSDNDGIITGTSSTGISVDSGSGVNRSGYGGYVGWAWDAGSSTVTNTDGSITSTLRANPTAGFSIGTWTGTAIAGTIGHGLGVAPEFIIVKNRSVSDAWYCYHKSLGNAARIQLNETSAATTGSSQWNSTSPTSTVYTVGGGAWQGSGNNFVTYAFAPVDGYSSFGSYTGNGIADGPFVYTGFRPRWVMLKNSAQAGTNWLIVDSARNTYNPTNLDLLANSSATENNYTLPIDFLSNGFKFKQANANYNSSSENFIYAVFAENPFALNARAR